jgi:hypothetical protein
MLAHSHWLSRSPDHASRLAARPRTRHRHPGQSTRRSSLDARRPGVLAELLNLHPTTAVRWIREAGGDWNSYAAELARTRNHQPCE